MGNPTGGIGQGPPAINKISMKALHKLNELNYTINKASETKAILLANILSQNAHSFLDQAVAATLREQELWAEWRKLPAAKRKEAEDLHAWALKYMDTIAKAPRSMSGSTYLNHLFGETGVLSATSKGDRYSSRVAYRKTDVTHTVSLSPEDCEYLWRNQHLIEAFPKEVHGHWSFLLSHNPKTNECKFVSIVREKLELRRGYLYPIPEEKVVGVGDTIELAKRNATKQIKLEKI